MYTCIISMDGVAQGQGLGTGFLWDVKKNKNIKPKLGQKGKKKSHSFLAVEKWFLGAEGPLRWTTNTRTLTKLWDLHQSSMRTQSESSKDSYPDCEWMNTLHWHRTSCPVLTHWTSEVYYNCVFPNDLNNQLMGQITACFRGKLVVITDREPSGKQKKKTEKKNEKPVFLVLLRPNWPMLRSLNQLSDLRHH